MSVPRRPLFLARSLYRGRRLADAARVLPILGAFLVLLPILWRPAAVTAGDTGRDALYLFAVWAGLIVATGLIAPRLMRREPGEKADREGD
jgi:predicted PurR-regulated permease PerM